MSLLTLLGLSVLSTFVPGLPEGTSVYYVESLHWPVLAVAVICAAGQTVAFAALFWGGEELILHWQWLGRQVAKVRVRFEHHLERRFLIIAILAGVAGIPPAAGVAALGSGFGVPFRHLMPVMYLSRVVRFVAIILFGAELTSLWHLVWPR